MAQLLTKFDTSKGWLISNYLEWMPAHISNEETTKPLCQQFLHCRTHDFVDKWAHTFLGSIVQLHSRVSQNAPKCSLTSVEVHVAAFIPQEPPKKISWVLEHFWAVATIFGIYIGFSENIHRKICHRTIIALISCRKVQSTRFLHQIAAFL